MGVELVVLAPREASADEWIAAAASELGGARVFEFAGGMREILDPTPLAVLSWWPAREIENERLVVEELGETYQAGMVWTDVCLIHGREDDGRRVVAAVADAVGGAVWERQ